MVKGDVTIDFELICDTCGEKLSGHIFEDIANPPDADWEIECFASEEGWEVDGDNVLCYDCCVIRDTSEEDEDVEDED